ncbi:MAG: asparagine synthase (glutamine-hydrolyzing) [Chloroflexi bacterium]|nr:asparagine synthase (glutamine-hydrolyzing) [Chloroflexota bacterium]
MCGITGTVNIGDGDALARMTGTLAHRGPDDAGLWEHQTADGGYVGLGSRRLAIIDRSPAGHMPMTNEDGSVWLTYNGEIYNFRDLQRELAAKGHTFRSNTDTEVIIHLYEEDGPDCVKRLRGMFAFGLYDLRRERLLLARDHFGVKPLYYRQHERGIAFASEVKALTHLPGWRPRVDPEALHQYLTFLWVPDPDTMFEGVKKLLAGHYALFHQGRLDLVRYWDLDYPPAGADFPVPAEELAEEVRHRLEQSVRSQMVSDVPVGAFLSAGIDSSSVVAAMAAASDRPVRTYTITFPPGDRAGERTLDDPKVAAATAQHFGCDHHEIVVEPRVADILPRLVWHMDEPVADPAIIGAYLVAREARGSATVLLSGLGGDELFAGYRKYVAHRWASWYRRMPALVRRGVVEPALLAMPPMRGTPVKGMVRLARKMARSASLPPQDAFLMNCTYLDEAQKAGLYAKEFAASLNGTEAWRTHREYFQRVAHADFLNQMLYVDTKAFMVSLNLTYTDKMSMASSVEVRVPFLDKELAEFVAWNVPPDLKLSGGLFPETKSLLRRAMEPTLPKAVLGQPKAGFGAPVAAWLDGELRPMVDDLLAGDRVRRRGYFEPGAVARLIAEHRSGRHDWSMQLWQLLTLELWMQAFIDEGVEATRIAA